MTKKRRHRKSRLPEPLTRPASSIDAGAATWTPEPDSSTQLEENWLFRLRRTRYRSRLSDRTHEFYVVELPDAVNVVALTPAREVVLVRQFRAGSNLDSLETPGGLLEPGEDPCSGAARELKEETGYAGEPPILLGTVWANPSILSGRISTVLIRNVRRVREPKFDHAEELVIERVPAAGILTMIREGRINHALVVGGLLWWLVAELPGPLSMGDRAVAPWAMRRVQLIALLAVAALVLALALLPVPADVYVLLALGTLAVGLATIIAWAIRLITPRRRSVLARAAAAHR